jgi:hypothetical protein
MKNEKLHVQLQALSSIGQKIHVERKIIDHRWLNIVNEHYTIFIGVTMIQFVLCSNFETHLDIIVHISIYGYYFYIYTNLNIFLC